MPESLFNKVAGLRPATLLKKRDWHMGYHVNFAKFLRARSLTEYLGWLLLHVKTDIYLNVIDKDCNFLIITEVVV